DERAERGPVARRRRGEPVVADAREQGGHPPRGGREVGHRGHAGTSVVGSGPVAGGGSAAGEPARVPEVSLPVSRAGVPDVASGPPVVRGYGPGMRPILIDARNT